MHGRERVGGKGLDMPRVEVLFAIAAAILLAIILAFLLLPGHT